MPLLLTQVSQFMYVKYAAQIFKNKYIAIVFMFLGNICFIQNTFSSILKLFTEFKWIDELVKFSGTLLLFQLRDKTPFLCSTFQILYNKKKSVKNSEGRKSRM